MNKRVLMVATVPSMIGQFNMNNIGILLNMGFDVDVACDFTDTSVWPSERIKRFQDQLRELNVEYFQLDFSRSPLKLGRHIRSYKETLQLIQKRQYAFIHTHTPIASAIVRIAAHKTQKKAIYTAHGFHFYRGSSKKNWIIFYPVERLLSRYTDTLITITKEDYERAKAHFKAKKTVYVPGVGVDTELFAGDSEGRARIRRELGIPENRFLLLSVGELNENKNHKAVIHATAGRELTYVIVGKGELKEELEREAKASGTDLRMTGFRTDVADFYHAADAYILPSIREGLNVSLMEAMASGCPCLCGRVRGNVDLIDDHGGYMFNPCSEKEIREAIGQMINADRKTMGQYNKQKIQAFSLTKVNELMTKIYQECI